MSHSTHTAVCSVVGLWRYPVKSMMGEELNAAEVNERGLVGDRAYALVDGSDGKVASAKNPRKWPQLFDFRAAFVDAPRTAANVRQAQRLEAARVHGLAPLDPGAITAGGEDPLQHQGEDDPLEVEGQAPAAHEAAQQGGKLEVLPEPLEDQDGAPELVRGGVQGPPSVALDELQRLGVGDEAFDHPIEIAGGDGLVEAAKVGDDVLRDAAPLAPRLDDLQVLVVAAIGAHPFDSDKHCTRIIRDDRVILRGKNAAIPFADPSGFALHFRRPRFPVRCKTTYLSCATPLKPAQYCRRWVKPQKYIKRGGFIYPDLYGEGSVPRLIDIATTVEANHRRREQYLEIATVTFTFAMILTSYATPPGRTPPGRPAQPVLRRPGLPPTVRRVTWQNLAEWEQLELAETGGRISRKMREGGHIIEHHIEITDTALKARAGQTAERVATKFTDADVAVNAVNRTVDQNWGQLRSFLGKLKTGEAEFLELAATMDRPIGYGYKVMPDGSIIRLDELRRMVVYVQADGVGGWLVRTAFPTP